MNTPRRAPQPQCALHSAYVIKAMGRRQRLGPRHVQIFVVDKVGHFLG
jgi:hypothetical protein